MPVARRNFVFGDLPRRVRGEGRQRWTLVNLANAADHWFASAFAGECPRGMLPEYGVEITAVIERQRFHDPCTRLVATIPSRKKAQTNETTSRLYRWR